MPELLKIVRSFALGDHSMVITIPKGFGVEKGTQFIARKDADGRITYEPLELAFTEKARESLREKAKN